MIVQEEHFGGMTFLTVSDIGANHLANGIPNQDAAAFYRMGEDFVLAVSDGVGSCSRAELGAGYAVSACVRLLKEIRSSAIPFESGPMLRALTSAWRTSIPEDDEADDYCATLKAVFKLGGRAKVLSVGDGFAALTSDGLHLLSPMDEALFTNETRCLNAQIQESDFWTADFPLDLHKPYVILCCTDGVANGLIAGTEIRLVEEIEKELTAEDLATALTDLLKDISNYCLDDKTVGVVKFETTKYSQAPSC